MTIYIRNSIVPTPRPEIRALEAAETSVQVELNPKGYSSVQMIGQIVLHPFKVTSKVIQIFGGGLGIDTIGPVSGERGPIIK